MKKRLLITGLLVILAIITLLLIRYVIDIALRKPVLHEEFASIVPATPLAYVQCLQLKARWEQFTNSPDYRTFIQSEFVKQLRQDERSAKFILQLDQFWHSLFIDPMHIIGTDVAIAVYNAEKGEIIPGVILVSKVNQIAKIAERISYAFDRLGAGFGITFEQEYQHFPIYSIEQPDMICPLFYTIIEDIGMISTSLPLLKNTIRLALSKVEDGRSVNTSPFKRIVHNIPDKRFVTCYLDLPLFFKELRENPIFRPLGLPQKNIKEGGNNFPFLTIHLDTYADEITLRSELLPAPDISEYPGDNSEAEVNSLLLQDNTSANFPIVAAFYRKKFTSFLQTWQELFPQWEWVFPVQLPDQPGDGFGEMIECSVSAALLGTLYVIPDIACVFDTQHPGRTMAFLDATIENMLDQMLSPMAQRAVKMSSETYGGMRISKIHFMFQEILNYAVAKSGNGHSRSFYTTLATNGNVLKAQIDSLQAPPGKKPYVFRPRQDNTAFVVLLKNDVLSEFVQNASQTNTFSLLYPRYTHRQLYQLLPFLVQFLKPLPPVLIEGGTKGTGLYLELRSRGKSHLEH